MNMWQGLPGTFKVEPGLEGAKLLSDSAISLFHELYRQDKWSCLCLPLEHQGRAGG